MPIRTLLIAATALLLAAPARAATLTLRFTGLERNGPVLVALFADERGFRAGRPVAVVKAAARDGRATAAFSGLEAGDYAVKCFQDGDNNGVLSLNLLGIPQEPYAFSNNARGRFGPPGWAKAAFALRAGGTAQTIALD